MTKSEFTNFLESLIQTSKQLQQNWPYSDAHNVSPDTQNELECIALYKSGWKHDGFKFVPDTFDIIVDWIKDDKRKSIKLTQAQQIRWIKAIKELKK